ncbi:hypothetical protein OF001_U100044 [Pseudomonas sp. OF001]|nr:hypothetical protein OF001_U100044 [Pseudomonas sp. OF001]
MESTAGSAGQQQAGHGGRRDVFVPFASDDRVATDLYITFTNNQKIVQKNSVEPGDERCTPARDLPASAARC